MNVHSRLESSDDYIQQLVRLNIQRSVIAQREVETIFIVLDHGPESRFRDFFCGSGGVRRLPRRNEETSEQEGTRGVEHHRWRTSLPGKVVSLHFPMVRTKIKCGRSVDLVSKQANRSRWCEWC